MRVLKGFTAATVVGIPLALYLYFAMHATVLFAGVACAGMCMAIFAVVSTRSVEGDVATDRAWRAAAPDLPPASDRRAMEAAQSEMPGPERAGPRAPRDGAHAGRG